jgi:hypothetical protein
MVFGRRLTVRFRIAIPGFSARLAIERRNRSINGDLRVRNLGVKSGRRLEIDLAHARHGSPDHRLWRSIGTERPAMQIDQRNIDPRFCVVRRRNEVPFLRMLTLIIFLRIAYSTSISPSRRIFAQFADVADHLVAWASRLSSTPEAESPFRREPKAANCSACPAMACR